jgi:hypothetical protein
LLSPPISCSLGSCELSSGKVNLMFSEGHFVAGEYCNNH